MLKAARGLCQHLTQDTLWEAGAAEMRREEEGCVACRARPSRQKLANKLWVTPTDFGLVVRPRRSWLNSSFSSHGPLLSPLDEGETLRSWTCPLITCTGSTLIFTIDPRSCSPKASCKTILTSLRWKNKNFLSLEKKRFNQKKKLFCYSP